MDRAGLYLKGLVEEYLSTPQDRRRVRETLAAGAATVGLILAAAVVLLML